MKKVLLIALSVVMIVMLSVSSLSVSAADFNCDVDTSSDYVYMENLDTGNIVFEKNSTEKTYPASLTKIMTYIVVAENVPDFEGTTVTIKEEAFEGLDPESSVMGLQSHIGESFTVLELLYGMMVPSGNDAAWVLADYVGNGVDNFVDMMNRKAQQLKCDSTHFVNPHGLYDPDHYSTASDIAVITKYAMNKPRFSEITDTVEYTIPKMEYPLETTNYMIDPEYYDYYYENAKGIKTGYTDEAGKCLVSTAQYDGYNYLCIAMGAPYSYVDQINYAMLDSKALYEWAFDSIAFVQLLAPDEVIRTMPVQYVWGDAYVDAIVVEGVSTLLPVDYDDSLVTAKIECPRYVTAPINKGDVFGTISVYYDNELVSTTDIVSGVSIERDTSNYVALKILGFIVDHIVLTVIVLIIIVSFLILSISSHKRKKKRAQRFRYR